MSARNKFLIVLGVILVDCFGVLLFFYARRERSGAGGDGGCEPDRGESADSGADSEVAGGGRNAGKAGGSDRVAGSFGVGGGGARGGGHDCEHAVAGERERIHAAIDEGIDVGRRGEFAGEAAVGARAIGAGGSDVDAGGERQPADDWISAGGRGVGSGAGAGGDESEGASRRACSR